MAVTRVPLLDLRRATEPMEAELTVAFQRVLRSGQFVLGAEVERFEADVAARLGCRHAVGVSSGTDALLVASMALGIGPGDEVVCPTYSFFATASSVARLGARPVFVDVEPRGLMMDPAAFARAITPRTKAVVPVHLFGALAAVDAVVALAKARGLAVVEDAAQAFGAVTEDGRAAGTLGTVGCFSFFPSKNLGALGDGGLVVTDDDALAARVRSLRVHGAEPKYHHLALGGNFRLDALQAAFLAVKLPRLPEAIAARRRNAAYYAVHLEGLPLVLPPSASGPGAAPSTFHQYVVRVADGRRDALRAFLAGRHVGTEVYYPRPLHLQPCFAALGHNPGDFPVAEAAAQETLALPIFPGLTDEELAYVVAAVRDFFRGAPG